MFNFAGLNRHDLENLLFRRDNYFIVYLYFIHILSHREDLKHTKTHNFL